MSQPSQESTGDEYPVKYMRGATVYLSMAATPFVYRPIVGQVLRPVPPDKAWITHRALMPSGDLSGMTVANFYHISAFHDTMDSARAACMTSLAEKEAEFLENCNIERMIIRNFKEAV